MTPVLTPHARARCEEMGVRTKLVKRGFRHYTVDYGGNVPGAPSRVRLLRDSPVALVYLPGNPVVIVTVLWQTTDDYERAS